MRALALVLAIISAAAAEPPSLTRVYPLGGQAGTTVTIEFLGARLSNATSVVSDSRDLVWKRIVQSSPNRVSGELEIAVNAALGAHTLRVASHDGPSNSVIFNVGQFPSPAETEPNDRLDRAQPLDSLPVEIQGRLDGGPDIDIFSFTARRGERRVFDLRSIEDGSAVEVRMYLLDVHGKPVAFNDDRDDFNENPLIEYTFAASGNYFVKLDQYRGPRGFNFGKLCAYTLRISSLPVIRSVQPLTLARGAETAMRLTGSALEGIEQVYLTELRQAEHARMTYPYTTPIRFRPDPPRAGAVQRMAGRVMHRTAEALEAEFGIPGDAPSGLWALWTKGRDGALHAMNVIVSDGSVRDGESAGPIAGPVTINGALFKVGERDVFRVEARAGEPLHFSTRAAQLGVPFLDSVLILRDAAGKKLAESDDVVGGQGTLLGNPDSSLFYTPPQDGPLFLELRDRTRRGGAGFEYSLVVEQRRPGFQLFTTPENFTIASGGSASIKVHLVREAGFEGEVDVWFEGLPLGVQAERGRFRADQLFEPNADGADMIIPEIAFRLQTPGTVAPGEYAIRVFGAPARDPARKAEAHTALMMGPLLDAWNFIRRPLPAITMTVTVPFAAALSTDIRSVRVERGKSATIELKAENVPPAAAIRVVDLPPGVAYRVLGRQGAKVTVSLDAADNAAPGAYDIAAETEVDGRRAGSAPIALSIAGEAN